jgi:molybdopterin-guanine dinucleotide biosynthesis protein A
MNNLLGVVLCGGESKRMGTDKGLVQQGDKTWAQIVAGKMSVLGFQVVVSINDRQIEDYGRLFLSDQLVVDSVDINGPLRGLLTVHERFPHYDILLMACDLIDMDSATIENLIGAAQSEEGYEFYVYENHGLVEPFCAIYTSNGLKSIFDKAVHNALSQNSFQSILASGKTRRVVLDNTVPFRNYNTMPGHHKI